MIIVEPEADFHRGIPSLANGFHAGGRHDENRRVEVSLHAVGVETV